MNNQESDPLQDDGLRGYNSELVNTKFSDAASENERDTERELGADVASTPSYELHTETENHRKENEPATLAGESNVKDQEETEGQETADQDAPAKLSKNSAE